MSVEIRRKAPKQESLPIEAITAGGDGGAVEFRHDATFSLDVRLKVIYGHEKFVRLSKAEVLALAAALNLWAQQ